MRLTNERVVVCGAGGFIGGHLVRALLNNGVNVVRAVDVKPDLPVDVAVCASSGTPVTPVLVNMLLFTGITSNPGSAFFAETEAFLIGGPGSVIQQQQFTVMGVSNMGHGIIAALEAT